MSCPTTSLVAVSKADALRGAKAILESIAKGRADTKERLIQQAMTTKWHWMWTARCPFVRHLSRKEAEEMVESAGLDGWGHWRWEYGAQERRMEAIVSASHLSQDGYVWLNLDDARQLGEWL